MRSIATLALVLLGLGLCACGGESRKAPDSKPAASSSGGQEASVAHRRRDLPFEKRDADGDNDSSGHGRYDDDDSAILRYGRAADAAEKTAVAGLIGRYYSAAAAADGSRACAQIYSLFAETIPEDYGQPPGPPSLRGKTCAVVLSKMFRQERRKWAADGSSVAVTGVRVEGNRGYALLAFKEQPDRHLLLHRERGTWKVAALVASELP